MRFTIKIHISAESFTKQEIMILDVCANSKVGTELEVPGINVNGKSGGKTGTELVIFES